MNSIPQQALPLATTSAFTPGSAWPQGRAQGWQRHLQEAVVNESAQHAARPARAEHAVPMRILAPSVRTGSVASPAVNAPELLDAAAFHPGGGTDPCPAGISPGTSFPVAGDAGIPDEEPASAPHRPSLPPPREVRVHVEETASGIALWLGINGEAAAAHAAVLLPELRRHLETQALRIARVVCNGHTIYQSPESSKEKT